MYYSYLRGGSFCVVQTGLKFLESNNPPASASHIVGTAMAKATPGLSLKNLFITIYPFQRCATEIQDDIL